MPGEINMVKMPGLDKIKQAYKEGATKAPAKYAEAVRTTTGVIQAAKDAEELYAEQMQKAIANKSRLKGLEGVTDEDWKKGALEKGANRIGPGMAGAVDKQAAGYQPFHAALSQLELPKRVADGRQNLINRGGAVVDTMIKTKEAQNG